MARYEVTLERSLCEYLDVVVEADDWQEAEEVVERWIDRGWRPEGEWRQGQDRESPEPVDSRRVEDDTPLTPLDAPPRS